MDKIKKYLKSPTVRKSYLAFMMVLFASLYIWQIGFGQTSTPAETSASPAVSESQHFVPFALFSDPKFDPMEIVGLITVLVIAICGLLYALLLMVQVNKA